MSPDAALRARAPEGRGESSSTSVGRPSGPALRPPRPRRRCFGTRLAGDPKPGGGTDGPGPRGHGAGGEAETVRPAQPQPLRRRAAGARIPRRSGERPRSTGAPPPAGSRRRPRRGVNRGRAQGRAGRCDRGAFRRRRPHEPRRPCGGFGVAEPRFPTVGGVPRPRAGGRLLWPLAG